MSLFQSSRSYLMCFLGTSVSLLLSSTATADVIEVPANHATIQAAVTAANPDDTILITNSATYDIGTYTFNKRIHLKAAEGEAPTVQGAVIFGVGAAGSRIGDSAGGRITFDGNGLATQTFRYALTETDTWFENLLIKGSTSSSMMMWGVGDAANPVDVTLNFTDVTVDATGAGYGWRPHNGTGNGSVHNFTRCRFTGAGFQGIFFSAGSGGGGTYNFDQCDISENTRAGIYVQEAAAGAEVTINVTRSYISGGPGVATPLRVYASGAGGISPVTISLERCVLRPFGSGPAAIFQVFGGGTNNNVTVNFIKCDLLAVGASQSALSVLETASESLAITLLDCNVIATGSATGLRNDNTSLQSPILATNCNIVANTPGSPATVQIVNPVTPAIMPNYVNLANRDYRYPNAALLTASSTGGPVGSYLKFDYTAPDLPGLPEVHGRFSTQALENIRNNRDTTVWGAQLANQYYGAGSLSRYSGLSDEQLRDFIPDLTPFRSVFCPQHPIRRWYNWQFIAPDRVMCLDAPTPHFFFYDQHDTTEDWNVQGTIRYERVQHVLGALVELAVSYHVNGNERHGEQAAVIVRRFAEAWPQWKIKRVNSWTFHDEPFANAGRLGGWYVADGIALGQVAEAYGLLKNTELFSETDRVFIEAILFNEAIAFFQHPANNLGFKSGTIANDEPAIYTGIAKIAVATGNNELADWVISEVAEVYNPARGMFHPDGFWYEGAMNYHMMSADLFLDFPQVLQGYNGFDAFEDPRFEGMVRSLKAPVWFMWSDGTSPPTNDGHRSAYGNSPPRPKYPELLYHATGDEEMLTMAQHVAGLRGLTAWQSDISLRQPAPVIESEPPVPGPLPSHLFPDMGYVHFRHGEDIMKQMAATLIYSSMVPHGHFDNNAILLLAHGHEMAMDIGYLFEQYTRGWATTTLGHNTVTVNRTQQQRVEPPRPGELLFSMLGDPIQAAETEGAMVYSAASVYRRLIATIPFDDEEAYLFDVFRVNGGTIHDWRLQSNGQSMNVSGVGSWAPWPGAQDYRVTYFNQVLTNQPTPFQEAEVATPLGVWTAQWDVAPAEGVSYRVHVIPQEGDEVVRASIPAARDYNRSDIDARMPGLMIHRTTGQSVFVVLHEPIKDQARIQSVESLEIESTSPTAIGVRVELSDGSSHLLFSTGDSGALLTAQIDGSTEVGLVGRFAAIRFDATGKYQSAALGNGTRLWGPGLDLELSTVGNIHVVPMGDTFIIK